ncbi:MAG TPA: outer membrane beta-barrel protein [Gammaproteobacteria bacterium]|nr:outer membrane beta-barrel protein [Gammaproteobacteria bacterium]
MKWTISLLKTNNIVKLIVLFTLACSFSSTAFARHCKKHHCTPPVETVYKDQTPVYTFVPNWYVGGHVGVSRTHDKAAPGSGDSVTQIGPGWTADLGYNFYQYHRATFAGELGYTQYHNSNETTPGTNVASTEHFAAYLAAVGQFSLIHNLSVLGKLGVAYSYAKKVFTTTGASASANTYSPYYGAGFSYNVTPQAALVLQWARARGNGSTGSTDLTSLGVTYNFL